MRRIVPLALLLASAALAQSVDEFIYESAPFPSAHASTVVELAERRLDVGLVRRDRRRPPRCRHLGRHSHQGRLERPARAGPRAERPHLEPRPLPHAGRQALAVLQIRPQSRHLDRRPPVQHRRRQDLVGARASARGPLRPDPRQAPGHWTTARSSAARRSRATAPGPRGSSAAPMPARPGRSSAPSPSPAAPPRAAPAPTTA